MTITIEDFKEGIVVKYLLEDKLYRITSIGSEGMFTMIDYPNCNKEYLDNINGLHHYKIHLVDLDFYRDITKLGE